MESVEKRMFESMHMKVIVRRIEHFLRMPDHC